ncbi:MAG: FAD binding domain-containing protein [Candidatus Dormibacteraceae bacterium]
MVVSRPSSLEEALAELAREPGTVPLAGGTDLMVAINFGRERPSRIMSIARLEELRTLQMDGTVRCGAGVTYTRMLEALRESTPALAQAARTVGSPQIRNAGTLGGNLGTCSPAGDTLPVLAALDATVLARSRARERRIPFGDFMRGPKSSSLEPGELVAGVQWEDAGPAQAFLKAGTRNAMVISVASLCLVADRRRRRVGLALGSVGPVIVRAGEAERFAEGLFEESGWERPLRATGAARARFAELAGMAARPIDDVRGTAAYRRHVVGVMAGRALARVGAAPARTAS